MLLKFFVSQDILQISPLTVNILKKKEKCCLHWGFPRRRFWDDICNMVNIFTCRCPNRSGVGAIDSPDQFEQVLD